MSSSVTESTSENENRNSSSSDNETFTDSPVKQKRKRRCIQLLCDGYETKLDTVETGRNNEADDKENLFEIAEEEEDIHPQTDSKMKDIIFYHLKVVKELVVIESDDE